MDLQQVCLDVLSTTAELVDNGWTQFEYVSEDGQKCCLVGAICRVIDLHPLHGHDRYAVSRVVKNAIRRAISLSDDVKLEVWNDKRNRQRDEVKLVIMRAIDDLEREIKESR